MPPQAETIPREQATVEEPPIETQPIAKRKQVFEWINAQTAELAKALPRHLDQGRFLRVVLTAINQQPKLLLCTRDSLMLALMRAAQLGLEPDGLLGQAWIIPYWNGKLQSYEAQFQAGYLGLIELARRSGHVDAVIARLVYSNDVFDYNYGLEKDSLTHKPAHGERGELLYAYCIVRQKNGLPLFSVLDIEEIETQHRARSKAKDKGPWVTDYEAMCLKTAVRVQLKMTPKSVDEAGQRLARALAIDAAHDRGLPVELTDDERAKLAQMEKVGAVSPESLADAVVTGKDTVKAQAGGPAAEAHVDEPQGATVTDEELEAGAAALSDAPPKNGTGQGGRAAAAASLFDED